MCVIKSLSQASHECQINQRLDSNNLLSLLLLFWQVQFEVADATKRVFPEGTFDVVYSRDTILHISDKLELFKHFYVSMVVSCYVSSLG